MTLLMLYQKQSVLLNSAEAEFIFSEGDNCQGWVVGVYRLCLVSRKPQEKFKTIIQSDLTREISNFHDKAFS